MSEDRTLPPDRERGIEAELEGLPSVAPDPSFRARMRAGFAAGSLESTLRTDPTSEPSAFDLPPELADGNPSEGPEALLPPSARESRDPIDVDFGARRTVRSRPVWRMWLVPAVAAAAMLLLYLMRPTPPDAPPFEILANGTGNLTVGELTFPIEDLGSFRDRFVPGTRVLVEGDMSTELQMTIADDFTLVAIAGAEFTVPIPPRTGRQSFRVDMGEVRVATLAGIDDEAIEIGAPGTRVDVMGTTLAVIADEVSTCVCLLEGTAMMMMKDGGMAELEPGMRRIMHMDPGVEDEIAPIFGNERMKLEMLRSAVGPSE